MFRFVIKRLLVAIPTLWAVLTTVFVLIRVVPGDPTIIILGDPRGVLEHALPGLGVGACGERVEQRRRGTGTKRAQIAQVGDQLLARTTDRREQCALRRDDTPIARGRRHVR